MTTNRIISLSKEEDLTVVACEVEGKEIFKTQLVFSPREDKQLGMKWERGEVFYILFCGEKQNRYFVGKELLDHWVVEQEARGT